MDGVRQELRIQIHRDLSSLAEEWRQLEDIGVGGPHDTLDWVEGWYTFTGRKAGIDPVIVSGQDETGRLCFILPLGLRRHRGLAILQWLASDQGNYASGLYHPDFWALAGDTPGPALLQSLVPHLPQADLIHLESIPRSVGGRPGPFSGLPLVADATCGHSFRLDGGADDYFRTHLNKKARGNLKRSERRLRELGELRFRQAQGADEVRTGLAALILQKREWCRQRGVADFLEQPEVQSFYESVLLREDGNAESRALLFTLDLDGEIIATNLGMRFGEEFHGLITTITHGDLRRFSPGNVLFRMMVEDVAARGVRVIDWGAGENDLKAKWCNVERERAHAVVALSARGAVAAPVLRMLLRLKAWIKTSPALWRLATQIRLTKGLLARLALALSGRGGRSRLASRSVEA
ncbi:MAG: GNAT family N-acetyltransferase [Pseudomonadota bacterium]|nr:GNAT family N-acetyltransferase [Pseudomonadota bacterium]